METSIFDYNLPEEYIALHPEEVRDECRLMVVDRKKNEVSHKVFKDVFDYFNEGDVLVLNNSKVLNARLYGKRKTGGKVEIFLLNSEDNISWQVLTNRSRRLKIEEEIFINDEITAVVKEIYDDGIKQLEFNQKICPEKLEIIGEVPLPPYIKKKRAPEKKDTKWYQTIYSKEYGSMACPTAGLHFTDNLLSKLTSKGVKIVYVTLHVSLSTFNPIRSNDIEEHVMHKEYYYISDETVKTIKEAKGKGNKVFAVGTTSVRSLEDASKSGELKSGGRKTDLFIKPGYDFKCCDAMITNFHTPRSTLLVLVSTFASSELIHKAYKIAKDVKYRFLSYGDAMLIL